MKRIELTRLLRENNYDYGFINKIIKNTFSDLKNFDLNLEIIKILLEQKKFQILYWKFLIFYS